MFAFDEGNQCCQKAFDCEGEPINISSNCCFDKSSITCPYESCSSGKGSFIDSRFSTNPRGSLRLRSQMSSLRQVMRQMLVHLSTLSFGVKTVYRTSDKHVSHTWSVSNVLHDQKMNTSLVAYPSLLFI